ncbi:anti-sigma-I factor RsgI [Moorella thermoacetica]|uniref:Anti-sigma-I factor RsgI n=1 Tax=Neomoorella thermoacetica TaxID=1525 RepID=A0A1J5P192_NEOTH|nr:anti-sigma-I factor RsgI [Moorella thermoacetica]
MDGAERGIVMAREGQKVIILTPRGDWQALKLAGPLPEVGEEIMLPPAVKRPAWPLVTAAAIVLLLVLAGSVVRRVETPAPAAAPRVAYYVNVDINPSVELAVDEGDTVLEARGLNSDGEKLLAGIALKGEKVTGAMKILALEALRQGYYLPEGGGAMMVTVIPAGSGQEKLAAGNELGQKLTQEARNVFQQAGVHAAVEAATVQPEIRQHAEAAGLSTGKYSIMLEALAAGAQVKVADLQRESITKVLQELNFNWEDVLARLKKDPDLLKKEEQLGPVLKAALGQGPLPAENGNSKGDAAARGPAASPGDKPNQGDNQETRQGKQQTPGQGRETNSNRGHPSSRDGMAVAWQLRARLKAGLQSQPGGPVLKEWPVLENVPGKNPRDVLAKIKLEGAFLKKIEEKRQDMAKR